jgi:hypothetical protein
MSEVPADIFQKACGIVMEAKSLKSMLRHKDVVDAIASALMAERQRCIDVIRFDSEGNSDSAVHLISKGVAA